MPKNQRMYKLTGLLVFIISVPVLAASTSFEASVESGVDTFDTFSLHKADNESFLLADAPGDSKSKPEPGELVIPGDTDTTDQDKKQCLNVCKKWGEDCIVNPRTGARNCRRTCKEFGVECF